MDQLHSPNLGSATDRTGGEGGHQQVPHRFALGQQTLHLAHDVHHVGVALDHHQLAHLDGARLADAAQVVAAQIHQHHVLGPLLGISQQLRLQGQVFGLIGAPGARACDWP